MGDLYTNQIFIEVLNHLSAAPAAPQLPADLKARLKGVQLAQELAATKRGQYKIRELLRGYQAPLRSRQDFEAEMAVWRAQLLDDENAKKALRKIFKEVTGSEINIPPELRQKTVLEVKKVVDTQHGVVFGLNVFNNEREKLEYQNKEVWADFKDKASESVNVGDKICLIPSLTVEKMIVQAEVAGLSMQSLGRLARCFVEAELPAVTSKVNNIHDENVAEIFSVIEAAIDVDEEIRTVERSLDEVKRAPGKFDLLDIVNVYTKKQHLLLQLRTGFAMTSAEMRTNVQEAADDLGRQALYNLVSPELKVYLMEDVTTKYAMSGQKVTLEILLTEAATLERQKPEWRIKQTMKPPRGIYGTVHGTLVGEEGAAGSVNTIAPDPGDELEEVILEENDDDYEDQEFQDASGEVFLLTGVRRVQMRPSQKQGSVSPGPGRRRFSSSPYKGRVTFIKRYDNHSSRPGRPGSPGTGPRGRGGGGRGRGGDRPTWRRAPAPRGRGGPGSSSGRTGTSKSPSSRKCLRCNSENHLAASCPRFGSHCITRCSICEKLGLLQFHPESLCFRKNNNVSYVRPESRSNSPATKERYGFRARRQGISPETKSKN